ncbi:hypothetical protein THTE_1182 [Thermogutta terrifontis]|uniref:Uncharacterized protein n=1 Tax=Thermogutta terrifontis TaxID=1331910 RepID=A0A286RCU2_9BACT|nr:hypothetical protein THTE_1182 [Thermogutta terrifontis]
MNIHVGYLECSFCPVKWQRHRPALCRFRDETSTNSFNYHV